MPTADGKICFRVGTTGGDGNDLHDATVSQVNGEWQVLARPRTESVDKLNTLFDSCFTAAPTCPPGPDGHGSFAIIWDGTVLYAPTVSAQDLADGPFSLGGGLTERRARDLAALVNS